MSLYNGFQNPRICFAGAITAFDNEAETLKEFEKQLKVRRSSLKNTKIYMCGGQPDGKKEVTKQSKLIRELLERYEGEIVVDQTGVEVRDFTVDLETGKVDILTGEITDKNY